MARHHESPRRRFSRSSSCLGDFGYIGYAVLRQLVFVVDGPGRRFCFALDPQRVVE